MLPWLVGVFDRWLREMTDGCNWVAGVEEVGVGLWGESNLLTFTINTSGKMENNTKWKGCWQILTGLFILGSVVNVCNNYTFEVSQLTGSWIYSSSAYNPVSMGGIIQKGNYPVNYLLEIKKDNTYKLYFGSPGFEKYKTGGNVNKHIWNGITLTNFSPQSDEDKDYHINKIEYQNKSVHSFCVGSSIRDDGCSFRFTRN